MFLMVLFGFFRKRISLRKFVVPCLVSNAVIPRAYMSSLSAAEDINKNESSKAYGSDQIQVFFFQNNSSIDSLESRQFGKSCLSVNWILT